MKYQIRSPRGTFGPVERRQDTSRFYQGRAQTTANWTLSAGGGQQNPRRHLHAISVADGKDAQTPGRAPPAMHFGVGCRFVIFSREGALEPHVPF